MTIMQPATPNEEYLTPPNAQRRRRFIVFGAAVLVLLAIAIGVFQPWLLFVNHEVNDEIPTIAAPQSNSEETVQAAQSAASEGKESEGPALLARGSLISHEHETSGTVSVFRLPDGTHQLALEGLETTTGPDVRVWLSQAPVIEGFDGWFTAANYDHLDLGELKGNRGNQVYTIPADADISDWSSITLWCEAFSVSFGAAELNPVQ